MFGIMELLTTLLIILFWGVIISLIVWGIRKFVRKSGASGTTHNAIDIAKERYARGEISKEQFEQLKKDFNS